MENQEIFLFKRRIIRMSFNPIIISIKYLKKASSACNKKRFLLKDLFKIKNKNNL
jgi:hypothetical protein